MSKGVVYLLIGALAFMAAFEIGNHSTEEANASGAANFLRNLPAGKALLILLTAGLLCYSAWRLIEFITGGTGKKAKWGKRLRYLFSAVIYLAVAFTAYKAISFHTSQNGDANQTLAGNLLAQPFGPWLVSAVALFMAATGGYQLYYGFSDRYKKHVHDADLKGKAHMLVYAGKLGYIARGIVWFIIAYLLMLAAMNANAAEAGDTTKALRLIEQSRFGSITLGAIGLGLAAYGLFNVLRAIYECFREESY